MSYLGKNLRKIRTIKKLSQSAFADLFELNRGNISAYEEERAEAKIDTIIQIAKYFGISLEALLSKELTVNEIIQFDKHFIDAQLATASHLGVPLVEFSKSKEYLKKKDDPDYLESLPQIMLPGLHRQMRAFECRQADMYYMHQGLAAGDIAICSKVELNLIEFPKNIIYITMGHIGFGQATNIDKHTLYLRPLNPNFEPKKEAIENIKESWLINQIITLQIPHKGIVLSNFIT